jgi:hypothetical protein
MKMRNEQLANDVDLKSRELAVTNMSLINKNELLTLIKEDLKNSSTENSSRSIKSVITNMSTEVGVQLAKVKTELTAQIEELRNQKVELTADTKANPQTTNQPLSAFEKFRNFNKHFNN